MAVPFIEVDTSEKPVQPVDDPYGTNAEIVFGDFSVPLVDVYPESTNPEATIYGVPEIGEQNSVSLVGLVQ